MRRTGGLEIVGQLSILADGDPLEVELQGSSVVLTLPSLRSALRLRRRFSPEGRRIWLGRLQSTLARSGLELQVRVRRRRVARLSAESGASWLAARLGIHPLELDIGAILASSLGR